MTASTFPWRAGRPWPAAPARAVNATPRYAAPTNAGAIAGANTHGNAHTSHICTVDANAIAGALCLPLLHRRRAIAGAHPCTIDAGDRRCHRDAHVCTDADAVASTDPSAECCAEHSGADSAPN